MSKLPSRSTASAGPPAPPAADLGQPAWAQGIKAMYDAVAKEPVPDDIQSLLDAIARRANKPAVRK